jgi:uncharacterized protein with ParB-like and HNH nuclease domain/predicted transport protein
MEPGKGSIYDLLNGIKQYIVPVYQRKYSWLKDKQCERLWNDIVSMEKTGKRQHFVGSIVNISETHTPMGIQKYLVIDGQQRMTTLTLLMIALRDYLEEHPVDDVNPDDLSAMLLKNDKQKEDNQYKLILNDTDKDVLIKLVDKAPIDDKYKESNLYKNYTFFLDKIANASIIPSQIYESIAKLQIVSITLKREDGDDPQLIFESLNSTGMDLSQSDLIRNFLLMGLSNDEQVNVYNNYWKPVEDSFPPEERSEAMDTFFRHYLMMKTMQFVKEEDVYETYKKFNYNSDLKSAKEFAEDIYSYGKCYTEMFYVSSPYQELNVVLGDMAKLKMDVQFPFLMYVYKDFKNDKLSLEDFKCILRMTEAYIVRRAICEIPTNSLNKTFITMKRSIKYDDYLNSLKMAFIKLDTYKKFPTDSEFKEAFLAKNIYKMRIANYLLVKLENYDNKEPIAFEGFTIEHIMPQNKDLSQEWRDVLGTDWEEIHNTFLHRIGNLTLTRYNTEMSDKPFSEKLVVLKESATHILNKSIVDKTIWNQEAMSKRAEVLVAYATKVWKYPEVTDEIIANYSETEVKETTPKYSLKSNKVYNNDALTRMFFDKLNDAILSLNPNIVRDFKKLYVAYKLHTNIVDVILQQARLSLIVNMDLEEVNDPSGICRDISSIGHWGNGDVGIYFDSLGMLEATIDIIKQSLAKQL